MMELKSIFLLCLFYFVRLVLSNQCTLDLELFEFQKAMDIPERCFNISLDENITYSIFKVWARIYDINIQDDRFPIFVDNFNKIREHNNKRLGYELGINQFMHLTQDEFTSIYSRPSSSPKNRNPHIRTTYEYPESIDWVSQGAVTPVKNQGACGSCWAFAAVGALESAYFLKTGTLVRFSEQQLVDCDKMDQGCNGGLMNTAFTFIKNNSGLCREDSYLYTGKPFMCKFCLPEPGSTVLQYIDVAPDEEALQEAVSKQPVAVGIEADQLLFQFYRKGVLTGPCGNNLDHGVLITGYGEKDGVKYWQVKNSWGAKWGDNGYIYIERGKQVKGGQCGILQAASYPVLKPRDESVD